MKHKILIVEDELAVLKLADIYLKMAGFDTIFAVDGQEAIEKIDGDRPDLILLDLRLPKMDGFQVFKKIRADKELAKIPVIFATADVNMLEEGKKLSSPPEEYLLKPYESENLIEKVKALLK